MGHRFEVWTHPSTGVFERRILRLPVESASFTPRNSGAAGGRLTLPPRYPYLSSVLRRDPLNPANDVRSVIRVFDDEAPDPTIPIAEMVPVSVPDAIDPSKSIDLNCEGTTRNFFRGAFVWAFDHPVFDQPDWIWGGANVLSNPSFENALITPERYTLEFDATGGTFDIDVDGDVASVAIPTTGPLLVTALEALTTVERVEIGGDGTIASPFTISFHDPADPFVTVDGSGLTGGSYSFAITAAGNLTPANWEPSRNPTNDLQHGAYSFWGLVTTPTAFDGVYSLAFNGLDASTWDFPGIQQLKTITPGLYQAKARVNPASATDLYALVIRDVTEGLADTLNGDGAKVEQTSAANTWATIDVPNVIIAPGREAIIYRVAYTGGGNPGEIRVDLAELRPGMAPATVGEILRLLLEDAAINHAGDALPRIALQFIDWTTSFSDTLDSNGNPWDRLLSVTVPRGWTYWQVLEMLHEQFGYEFELEPSTVVGEWILHVWNPGTRAEQDPDLNEAIIVGLNAVVAGPVAFEAVVGNAILAEGAGRLWTRAESAASIGAAGRIEAYVPMGNVLDQDTLDAAAVAQLAEQLDQGLSVQIVMAPGARPLLLLDLPLGARAYISVPGHLAKYAIRLDAVTLDWRRGESLPTRTGHWSREVWEGQTAVNEMTRRLAERAAVLNPPEPKPTPQLGGGGGNHAPTVLVAAEDSSELDQAHADIIVPTGAGNARIAEALSKARNGFPAALPGWVHFSAGHYDVDMSLNPSFDAQDLMITGVGFGYSGNGTVFNMFGTPGSSRPFLFEGEYSTFKDFGITDNTDYSRSITGIYASELTTVDNVRGWTSGHFIEVVSGSVAVKNCEAMFSGYGGDTGPNHCIAISGAVQYIHITDNILTGTDGYGVHTYGGNFFVETSTINGNIISDTGIGGIFLGITGADGTGTTGSRWGWAVVGNSLESTGTDWVDLTDRGAAIYLEYCPGSSVVGNTIANAFGHGIIVDASAGGSNIDPWIGSGGGLILSGNAITRSTGYPIWFRNEDTEIKYYPVTVAANHIGADSFDDSMICVFERVRDIAIVGNGFQRGGLYLLECEQMSIIGNKFADASYGNDGGTTGKTGIIELDDCHWCTIKDNDFQAAEGVVSNNPFACIYLVNGSDQNRIRGNDYLGAAALSVGATLIDHGVWFAASAGTNNRAVGNDFERCTGASIRDDVGGNITAWPGGGNDNW